MRGIPGCHNYISSTNFVRKQMHVLWCLLLPVWDSTFVPPHVALQGGTLVQYYSKCSKANNRL